MKLRRMVSFVSATVLVVVMSAVVVPAADVHDHCDSNSIELRMSDDGKTYEVRRGDCDIVEVIAVNQSTLSSRRPGEMRDLPEEVGQTEVVKSDENGTMFVTLVAEKESTEIIPKSGNGSNLLKNIVKFILESMQIE